MHTLLVSPNIHGNGSVTIPNLKKHNVVIVYFSQNGSSTILKTADGTYHIGAAGNAENSAAALCIMVMGAMATVSGNTITFKDVTYARYDYKGLGISPICVAGDSTTISEIYG